MSSTANRSWLRPFLRPLMPVFREVIAMSFFVNVLALAVPIFTLQVYDRVVAHAGISTLQGLVIGMILVVIFDYVLRQARSRIMQTVALRVDAVVGKRLFDKFTALPLHVLESRSGDYWQSLFRDVDVVRNTVSGASAILICDLPFAILFLGLILVIATPIAWVLLIVMPIFLFVAYRSGNVMARASKEERETTLSRDALIAEVIQGRTTIKALALEQAMRPVWEDRHADNIERAIVRGSKTDAYTNLGQTLSMVTSVSMISVGSIAIINQSLTMGALIATNMLASRLLGPLNQLVSQWRTFSSFRQAVERLGEVFNLPSERTESEIFMEKPEGDIVCENVTFSYADDLPPVCDHVTLSFRSGHIHALVGRNGSGKTTLLKILQGLYQPSSGRVLIDGADISQFTRAELASWMGYVPQDCVLFAGTVRDNVAHRFPNATDAEIMRAAKAAGVHQFIIDLPDGYGSDIGEAGRRLSGGQRQRIAIARALVGDPSVLLLDEPSASLDRQAEQELKNTLVELSKEHTIIMVTHSPVLLTACDELVALDKGKVALAGSSKEILPRLFGTMPKEAAAAAAVPTMAAPEDTRPQAERKPKPAGPAPAVAGGGAKPAMKAPRLGGAGTATKRPAEGGGEAAPRPAAKSKPAAAPAAAKQAGKARPSTSPAAAAQAAANANSNARAGTGEGPTVVRRPVPLRFGGTANAAGETDARPAQPAAAPSGNAPVRETPGEQSPEAADVAGPEEAGSPYDEAYPGPRAKPRAGDTAEAQPGAASAYADDEDDDDPYADVLRLVNAQQDR